MVMCDGEVMILVIIMVMVMMVMVIVMVIVIVMMVVYTLLSPCFAFSRKAMYSIMQNTRTYTRHLMYDLTNCASVSWC
jgi:ABC-type Na+ efflux pump permease subunit